MTQQPRWREMGNLGDVNPLEYGGFIVYRDTTGAYEPEVWIIEPPCEDVDGDNEDVPPVWSIYRFTLEPCTFVDGVLSDNPSHTAYAAWWASAVPAIATSSGIPAHELIDMFLSDDIVTRAGAYQTVIQYFGAHEFDQYPLTLTRREVRKRFRKYRAVRM